MPSNDLDNKCWKALAGIPGKARNDGFQMTVIGIFDITWANLLLKIIKLILVMRYMPHCLKKYAELPYQNQNQVNLDQSYFLMKFFFCLWSECGKNGSSSAYYILGLQHTGRGNDVSQLLE